MFPLPNVFLIPNFNIFLSFLSDQVMALIDKAKSNTLVHLTDIYSIPRNEHEQHVEELFNNLAKYSKHNATISTSVTKFFDQLLPLVFRYTVNDPSVTDYKESFNDCLMNIQSSLQPPPFGPFVRKLIHDLSLAFRASVSYQEALSDFIDLINQTNQIKIEETCKEGLTQMLFCSQCKGYIDVKPCKEFCEDVLHGCFSKVMEIFTESKKVIKQFQPFIKVMKEEHGLEVVVKSVLRIISEGIMHAMDKAPEFTPLVSTLLFFFLFFSFSFFFICYVIMSLCITVVYFQIFLSVEIKLIFQPSPLGL